MPAPPAAWWAAARTVAVSEGALTTSAPTSVAIGGAPSTADTSLTTRAVGGDATFAELSLRKRFDTPGLRPVVATERPLNRLPSDAGGPATGAADEAKTEEDDADPGDGAVMPPGTVAGFQNQEEWICGLVDGGGPVLRNMLGAAVDNAAAALPFVLIMAPIWRI